MKRFCFLGALLVVFSAIRCGSSDVDNAVQLDAGVEAAVPASLELAADGGPMEPPPEPSDATVNSADVTSVPIDAEPRDAVSAIGDRDACPPRDLGSALPIHCPH